MLAQYSRLLFFALRCIKELAKLPAGEEYFFVLVSKLLLHQLFVREIAKAELQAWAVSSVACIVTKDLLRMSECQRHQRTA
jgi:hypothetical protein